MNLRYVIREFGLVLIVLSLCMVAVMGWAARNWAGGDVDERLAVLGLVMSAVVGAVAGLVCWLFGSRSGQDYLGRREALLLVAMSWLLGAALAGLPYYTWAWIEQTALIDHPFASMSACYFEAMSGLTTTGATVLDDVDSIPKGLLLWRAMTHWLGGLGIVVLFVAVLPTLGVGGKKLFQVEAPGPQQQGVRPRIRETARVLWLIYLTMTGAQVLLLRLVGRMSWFDSVCHTFATLATGGFSTHNASIGAYDRWSVELITILFMVLAGVNFGLYYQLARRRFGAIWRDPELRVYLGILFVATLIVGFSIYGKSSTLMTGEQRVVGLAEAARQSTFQVVSIQTTTGFSTADFDLWGFVPRAVLVTLMFVGASAGSTGGGIKVIRILVALKVMLAEVERVFRPSVVRTTRVGSGVVDPEMRQAVLVYVLGIIGLFLLGTLALMLIEPGGSLDFTSAATASAASLNNIGPGLGLVGASHNYGFFTAPSKMVLSLLMVLGRLEVYAVLVLILPGFWRSD